ncbi:MAG: AAA family ATPase [Nannocystis sp.]|nr:AAA family ATPase [Nannocystis sp.]MBA3550046.1 AAA family ATPase [Nannocystis sp.]
MANTRTSKDPEVQALEQKLGGLPAMIGAWVHPIVKALTELGGESRPLAVEERIYHYYKGKLRPQQWAHVIKKKYVRWTRNELRKVGVLGGEKGHWALTELGQRYWRKHQHNPLEVPTDWPSLSDAETGALDAPQETVEVMRPEAYQIPLLRRLAHGVQLKPQLLTGVAEDLKKDLLPGDQRIVPQGMTVVADRAAWAISALKRNGEATNIGHGAWEITDVGRARLRREDKTWSIEEFRGSRATVRGMVAPNSPASSLPDATPEDADIEDDEWDILQWTNCEGMLNRQVYAAISDRIRPDVGPTPQVPLARNIIFYGPPGTGKTYTARLIAQALAGESTPSEDGRYRLVQFHPGYTYEDFIQGLRPDTGEPNLRYCIKPGPFVQICKAAQEDPDRFYVLVIDEINRGEPSRIFGEALFALEYRGRPVSILGGGTLIVPANLVVIGTMNSVDRSVALMDYALRRRFGFVYLAPDLGVVREEWAEAPQIGKMVEIIQRLNDWLRQRLGAEHMLGHSFFLNPAYPLDVVENLHKIWRLDIEPLLGEYLFHDSDGLQAIRKLWAQWAETVDPGPA